MLMQLMIYSKLNSGYINTITLDKLLSSNEIMQTPEILESISRNVFEYTKSTGAGVVEPALGKLEKSYHGSKELVLAEGFSYVAFSDKKRFRKIAPEELLVVRYSLDDNLMLLFDANIDGELDYYCAFGNNLRTENCTNQLDAEMQGLFAESLIIGNLTFNN